MTPAAAVAKPGDWLLVALTSKIISAKPSGFSRYHMPLYPLPDAAHPLWRVRILCQVSGAKLPGVARVGLYAVTGPVYPCAAWLPAGSVVGYGWIWPIGTDAEFGMVSRMPPPAPADPVETVVVLTR